MKKVRRNKPDDELNITSMMDMMTIILVFLLKSFSATEVNVTPSDNLRLPTSTAQRDPDVALIVTVQKNRILVDNQDLGENNGIPLDLVPYADPELPGKTLYKIKDDNKDGFMVPLLYDKFTEKRKSAEFLGQAASDRAESQGREGGSDLGFKGRVLLQIDEQIPFTVVRDVMFTAGQAKFNEFEFVVMKLTENQ